MAAALFGGVDCKTLAAQLICTALLASAVGCKSKSVEDDAPPRSEPWPNPLASGEHSVPVVGPSTDYHKVTETIDLEHYTIAVGQIKTCSIENYLKPKAGSTVLGVELILTGKGAGQMPSNPFYATLVGGDGARYAATLAGCKPELGASSLDKGDTARGFVSFVVPEGQLTQAASNWKLVYRPTIIGAISEEARFDLAR